MKNFYCLFTLLFMLVLSTSCRKKDQIQGLSYHYEKFDTNLNNYLTQIQFIDSISGYGISASGKVFKTLDKGLNWDSLTHSDIPIYSLYFVNKDIGYVVGGESTCSGTGCIPRGSVILKTINGGLSWTQQTVPYQASQLNSVFFIDENIGFAVGKGLQLETTDGGITWNKFELAVQMKKVKFINSQTGFVVGSSGYTYKTTDQGSSWLKANNKYSGFLEDFCFPDENTGYAAGSKEIVKTVDGGNNWTILTNSPTQISFIHFVDVNSGIAIGTGHWTGTTWTTAIYSTSDGGNSWKMEDNVKLDPTAYFPYSKMGYAFGSMSIYKITIDLN
jgi:photosystem II stability/assembly factor-like uncharacterized protein